MAKDTLPQVGDVIRSIRFVYGEKSFDKSNKRINVGRNDPNYIVQEHLTDEEIAAIVLETKKMPKGEALWVDRDYGSADLSRAKAEYVVIEALMQGGGTGHGPGDVYPDGWHVVAKRLDDGRMWNPDGEEIEFYMTGCFINMIPPNKVLIVGKMKMGFA
jgi:hypothetical protein